VTLVRLSSKYQVVIPADVRAELGLQPGQRMDVLALAGHLVIVPSPDWEDLFGLLRPPSVGAHPCAGPPAPEETPAGGGVVVRRHEQRIEDPPPRRRPRRRGSRA
jgi:AbrB family looped-hinge helix DNA binding protein